MPKINTDSLPGRYHRSGGGDPLGGSDLFVLPDHRFVVVFFGGAESGQWQIDKGMIIFTPTTATHPFHLFGRHNPKLGDSTRIFFQGFQEDETFIRLNLRPNNNANNNNNSSDSSNNHSSSTSSMQRVFNISPNCFTFPYITKFPGKTSNIALACKPYLDSRENETTNQPVYNFDNPENYNDFTAFYTAHRNAPRGFRILPKGNRFYFNEDTYAERRPLPTSGEYYEFIQQIANRKAETDTVFFNPWYNQAPASLVQDTFNYKYIAERDLYINFLNYTEEHEYIKGEDGFNQMFVVYPFHALHQRGTPVKQKFAIDAAKPLFVTKCDSDEQSPLTQEEDLRAD